MCCNPKFKDRKTFQTPSIAPRGAGDERAQGGRIPLRTRRRNGVEPPTGGDGGDRRGVPERRTSRGA